MKPNIWVLPKKRWQCTIVLIVVPLLPEGEASGAVHLLPAGQGSPRRRLHLQRPL